MLSGKTVLIVEDELLIATHLKTIVTSFDCKKVDLVHTQQTALAYLEKCTPDIVLLDINLNHKDEGIDLAAHINQTGKIPFIFITAYSDTKTLVKAVAQHPAAYITKPFKQTDVLAAMQLVFINDSKQSQSYLTFKHQAKTIRLNTAAITHIESSGNYITIFTASESYTIRNTLTWAMSHLPGHIFVRAHRAFIVNVHQITQLSSKEIMIGKRVIALSRLYKEAVFTRFHS